MEWTFLDESRSVIEQALRIARERLDMEVAWLASVHAGQKTFRMVEGREEWAFAEGDVMEAEASYCHRLLAGELEPIVPDTAVNEVTRDLEVTKKAQIGSYVGVPVVMPSGEVIGTFCVAAHEARMDLAERDVEVLEVISRLIAGELQRVALSRRVAAEQLRASTSAALLAALAARDAYSAEHSEAVVSLATRVAEQLGLSADELEEVGQVALVHDIGKVAVPDVVLGKQGALDAEEWALMREHPGAGAAIIATVEPLAHLAPAVRAEHERWDGRGYPDGLAEEEIPVASRIVLVCDAFDAMVSERPYRPPLSEDEARAELERHSGSQFWPPAVGALLALV